MLDVQRSMFDVQ